jgi:hypothetical protein
MRNYEVGPFLWRYKESTLKTDKIIEKIYCPGRESTKNEHRNAQVEFIGQPRTKNEHRSTQVEFVGTGREPHIMKNEHRSTQVEFIVE